MTVPTPSGRRPGPARSLSRRQVGEAGLAVLHDDGLSAVSFRTVAGALGVNPMALYTYVRDKGDLLAAVYDHVLATLDTAELTDRERPPQERIRHYFVATWHLYRRYTELLRLVRPGAAELDREASDRVYGVYAELGLTPEQTARAHLTLLQFTIGNALTWQATDGAGAEPDTADDLTGAVGRGYRSLDPEVQFRDGLALLLGATTGEAGR